MNSAAGLYDRVKAVLEQALPGDASLDAATLAGLDQFHVGGLQATLALAERLAPGPRDRVLDVGAGLGGPARLLVQQFGCRVVGVDLTRDYLRLAAWLTQRRGLAEAPLTWIQANACALPFAPGSFDCVWTQHLAMAIADRTAYYLELSRVLRPGGRLALHDIVSVDGGQPDFPVPWAGTAAASFLESTGQTRQGLAAAGFTLTDWHDRTAQALAWYAQQRANRDQQVDLRLIFGSDLAIMAGNLRRALQEGRVSVVEAILQK